MRSFFCAVYEQNEKKKTEKVGGDKTLIKQNPYSISSNLGLCSPRSA
jgi:hypothetical protein